MSSKFIHLHTHSHYSLLNALPKIDELVTEAKKNNMPVLALTDNANMYGTIEFYQKCKKASIKPIIGIDAYVAYRSRHDKTNLDKKRYRLVLLAENEAGYKNLMMLVTLAHMEGFYYKPRIDRELLEKYHEGLIAIAPALSSDILESLKLANTDQAMERLDWYKKTFGQSDFFFEITSHPEIKSHSENMKKVSQFASQTATPIVACHDVYYINPEDRIARETLMAVQTNSDASDKIDSAEYDFSFITGEQAEKYFKDLPDALENCQKIADRCNLELPLGKWILPSYTVENGLSHDDELKRLTYEGLSGHDLKETPEIMERIEYELKIICDKGYAPYFLVVSDLLHYARRNGILTTTRGSAGGSMVSYLNYITTINPIEFNLPFERFLNPDRPKAPDIDMDIADNRRDEMIEYAKKKHGADKVVQIGTFGTMAARGAVRDVTRALGFPYSVGDNITKMIPAGAQGFPMTLERALKENPELKKLYDEEADARKIIDMAKKIEGCARHISVHAAGVVIPPTPIIDYSPIQYDPKGEGKIITQYDMYSITDEYDGVGLLKFDFLGIRNLSILADAVKITEKLKGIKINLDKIPLDDRKTFEMLARGETIGLFQLNGDGMTRWLKELRPTTIYDINVMVALYRPGPMDNINEYIARKHGLKAVTYPHPNMKKFLDKTYGVLVYQDDLLMTAIEVAGYSWDEVDKFRKAVGKKIREEMARQHVKFVMGCQKYGKTSSQKAEELWNLFEPFQGYGFNKAHAASYGKVAYQTAYMKANFPSIYMSAVLTAESGNIEMIAEIITECKRMGIAILPPDVNQSFGGFTVVGSELEVRSSNGENQDSKFEILDSIRFGLTTIKNFGEGVANSIIAERKANGPFKSLSEFLRRIKDKNLNKKSLESLIKVGALDSLVKGENSRATLFFNLDRLLVFNKEERTKESPQDSLFGQMSETQKAEEVHLDLPPARAGGAQAGKTPETSSANKLLWEKELLGLYISGHPLDSFKHKLENREVDIKKLKETAKEREPVVVGGIVEEIKSIMTKSGDKMIFLKLADLTDSIEAVAFPKIFEEFRDILIPESCIIVKGTFSTRNAGKSVLIEKVKLME
ncbi:MAG: DNA polymerase III subunit alpha [Candidatus Zambryskibacteria bacterium]|nr:DNA polymerase III subunit alpha [Candidatus Zambryskibacteria bacterium]